MQHIFLYLALFSFVLESYRFYRNPNRSWCITDLLLTEFMATFIFTMFTIIVKVQLGII